VANLLETVVEAHGGRERWSQLDAISVHGVNGGVLWSLKGQPGVLDDVFVRASLHQERESHHPFGAPDRRSAFTPERVAIETTNGDVVEGEDGEEWRRLRVVWPTYLATHSTEQMLYVGADGLFRRHDYDVEISGGSAAAHYISDYTKIAGIMIPTSHRIFPRQPDGEALSEPLLVSIDVSEIAFT
jgi:hypothetical protein